MLKRRWLASGVALLFYTALAFLLFWQVWSAPGHRSLGSSSDPEQMMWFLGWTRFALSHHDNPLFSAFLDYPHGVNLMWNTSVLLPGVHVWWHADHLVAVADQPGGTTVVTLADLHAWRAQIAATVTAAAHGSHRPTPWSTFDPCQSYAHQFACPGLEATL